MKPEILKNCLYKIAVMVFSDPEIPLVFKDEVLERVIQEVEKKQAVIVVDKELNFIGIITLQSVMYRFRWGYNINNTRMDDLLMVGEVHRVRPSDKVSDAVSIFQKKSDMKVVPIVDLYGITRGGVTKESIQVGMRKIFECIDQYIHSS